MMIGRKETIFLDNEEKEIWARMHSILQEIYEESDEDEITRLSVDIEDYMEMLEKYFD